VRWYPSTSKLGLLRFTPKIDADQASAPCRLGAPAVFPAIETFYSTPIITKEGCSLVSACRAPAPFELLVPDAPMAALTTLVRVAIRSRVIRRFHLAPAIRAQPVIGADSFAN